MKVSKKLLIAIIILIFFLGTSHARSHKEDYYTDKYYKENLMLNPIKAKDGDKSLKKNRKDRSCGDSKYERKSVSPKKNSPTKDLMEYRDIIKGWE